MEETTTAEVIEITLERKIETELVKNNVTEKALTALKEKYGGLKLKALDDKESYLELKEAAKDCSKLRNLAVKVCKAGREDAVKVQKLWVAKEKEVVGRIEEVESPLDAEIAKFDAEVERKKNEERKRQEEAYMQRTQALTKMGATYSNETFTLGEFSMEANLVKETSQDIWEEKMLPSFTAEYQKIEAERIEQERIKAEKLAEEQRQREELAKQQQAFKDQQEAFKKQQEDAAQAEREKKLAEERAEEQRRSALQQKRMQVIAPFNPYNKGINTSELWNMEDEAFSELVADTKSKYESEQAEKQKQIEEQVAQKEREKIAEEQRQAEIKRQLEEQRKAEELAKAGDKAQWDNFIAQVSKVTLPHVKSGQYRKIAAIAKEKIEEILNLKPNV